MTERELSQLYKLNREIEQDEKRLHYLKGLVKDGDYTDNLIREQEALIHNLKERALIEQNRLYRYISEVEDSVVRQILSLRFVNGLSWLQVALHIGEYDESYVRRKCKKFLIDSREHKSK